MRLHNNILFSPSLYCNQTLIGHMLFCFPSCMNGDLSYLHYIPINRMPLAPVTVHLVINLIIFSGIYVKSKLMCTVLGPFPRVFSAEIKRGGTPWSSYPGVIYTLEFLPSKLKLYMKVPCMYFSHSFSTLCIKPYCFVRMSCIPV